MALRSLILSIGAKDENLTKTLEKIGALGAKTKDDLAKIGTGGNTKLAEKQFDDLAEAIKKSQKQTEGLTIAAQQTARGIELVGGVSRLTKTNLDQVNRSLQTGLDAYRALGLEAPKDLQRVADAVTKQRQALEGTGKSLSGISEQSGLMGQATSLLTGKLIALAGPAALGAAAKQALDYADNLTKMSDRTGIGVVALQRLEAIAKASGNSIEDIAGAVNRFQKGIASGELDKPIERLGLSVAALRAQSPDEQFISIAKAIQQIPDPAEQARTAMELFGRAGADLLPSLKADVDALANSTVKMSAESVKALDDFGDALGRWKTSAINSVGEVLGQILGIPQAIRDAQAAVDKAGGPRQQPQRQFSQASVTNALALDRDQVGGGAAGPVDDLADSIAELTAKIPPLVTNLAAARGAYLPMGVAAISAAEATAKANAQFGTLDEQLKRIAANAEAARVMDAINKKIAEGRRPVSELTEAQKQAATEFKTFGLSAQEIGIKLQVSTRSVEAFQDGVQKAKEQAKEFGKTLQDIRTIEAGRGALGPLEGAFALVKPLEDLKEIRSILTDISKIELRSSVVAPLGGAIALIKPDIKDLRKDTGEWGTALDDLSRSFSQIAQVSGGAFGGIAQEIGNIISSLDLATKAAKAYGEATTIAGKAAAAASGIAAVAQATGSGSRGSRVLGGAAAGAQAGSIAGPYGALVGAGVGALVGAIRGRHAEERQVNDLRDAFISAHGELSKLNEEAHKAGKTLDNLLHAKNVRDYNAAINDLNAAFEKQSRIQDGIASLGFKSRTELRQAAVDAQDVFEFMRQSGEYTAEQVDAAFKAMRQAQADAGDAAAAAEIKANQASLERISTLQKALDDLTSRRDGLAASIANEAPEEVMGVIEAATRGQIGVLDQEIEKQREQLRIASESAAGDLEHALSGIDPDPIHVRVMFDLDSFPRFEQPEGFSTGGIAGVQHFASGGRVLPFVPRGTDTVPAMLTPGEMVLTPEQQRQVSVALSGSLRPMDTSAMEARLAGLEAHMRQLSSYMRFDFQQANARAVRDEVQKVARAR